MKANRSSIAVAAAGVIVGMLIAGLIVPLAFGEDLNPEGGNTTVAAGGPAGNAGLGSIGGDGSGGAVDTSVPGAVAGQAQGPGSAVGGGNVGGGGSTAPTDATGSPDAGGGTGLGASDRGVAADKIKVGFVMLDVATVGRLGVGVAIDPEQQQAAWQAFVDDINDRGGIHGRTIEPHFRAYDVTDRNDQIAACRYLTQEREVFAVVGGFNIVDPNLCVIEENQTPLVSNHNNNPDWVYERGGGRLFTLYARSSRVMAAAVAELERVRLAGKKIGILTDGLNDPGGQVMGQLKQLLQSRGHTVTYTGLLSDDIAAASSQVPVEVNKAQGSGAELMVMLASNAVYGTQFVNQADSQAYHPNYVTTDWASNGGDTNNANMPRAYEGAFGISFWRGLGSKRPPPEPPAAARCRDVYNARSGRTLAQIGTTEYGQTMNFCDDIRVFEALATIAGPQLTRPALTGAVQSVGAFEAASWGGGTFGAGKFDFADLVRTQRWTYECKCWARHEEFHPPGG